MTSFFFCTMFTSLIHLEVIKIASYWVFFFLNICYFNNLWGIIISPFRGEKIETQIMWFEISNGLSQNLNTDLNRGYCLHHIHYSIHLLDSIKYIFAGLIDAFVNSDHRNAFIPLTQLLQISHEEKKGSLCVKQFTVSFVWHFWINLRQLSKHISVLLCVLMRKGCIYYM